MPPPGRGPGDEERARLADALKAGDDPYVIPGSGGVLKNKFALTDLESLTRQEGQTAILRSFEIQQHPPKATFDFAHLAEIHRRLFQDVYAWAGKPRRNEISKDGSDFVQHPVIARAMRRFADNLLGRDNLLKDLEPDKFSKRLAVYFAELNRIHPFREGNGRAQEIFFAQLAENAGYNLRWSRVAKQSLDQASIAGHENDLQPLTDMFAHCIEPIQRGPRTQNEREWSIRRESDVSEQGGPAGGLTP